MRERSSDGKSIIIQFNCSCCYSILYYFRC
nr:MAG TPA: hypothetical protein [Caudoviricetes sp.]